jgi:Tol biopolymer transport system component
MKRPLRPVGLLASIVALVNSIAPLHAANERVSVSTASEESFSSGSFRGRTDATGQWVVFDSSASIFSSNDDNGVSDIFLRDRVRGTTVRVSQRPDGKVATGASLGPSISADGKRIVYTSSAEDLVPGDDNGAEDVFVFDRGTGKTQRVSVSSTGAQADGNSSLPRISGNGRFVTFISSATNLVPNDPNGLDDVFVRDLQTGTTSRITLRPDGTPTSSPPNFGSGPDISHDGRFVVFPSSSNDLVADDTNNAADIFLHDRETRTTTIVSRTSGGVLSNGFSFAPHISGDGSVVAFETLAANLGAAASINVVIKDLRTGFLERARPDTAYSYSPSVSTDGSRVAFVGKVGSDPERVEVYNRRTGGRILPAQQPNGASAGSSTRPGLLAAGDFNGLDDVYARPLFDTIGFQSAVVRTAENNGNVTLTLTRDGVLNGAVSVQYAVSAPTDTALRNRDFTAAAITGTVSWADGDFADKSLTFPLIDTPAPDGIRYFTVNLSNPTGGAALEIARTQVLISDTETTPVEDRIGHGLQIRSLVQLGTNWSTGAFSGLLTIRNPAALPSFPGFVELQFNGAVLDTINFDAIPGASEQTIRLTTSVGSFPDGDLFAIVYETTPLEGAVLQDSAFAAGYVDNGTAPPSGGTTQSNVGITAPGFNAVTVKSIAIEGDSTINEGTAKNYTVKVTLSDNTVLANASPQWKTTLFSISPAGVFTAGDVAADKTATLSATVVRDGVASTGTKKVTVKNIPATPIITSPLTSFTSTGKPYSYRIIARNEPTTFTAAPLPAGLQLNAATGVISGTPTAAGASAVQITASNAIGTDTETLNLTVSDPSPLTVNIVGNGTVTPDLNGELLDVGKVYTLVAKPAAEHLFADWSNGLTSPAATLKFVMVPNLTLDATFVPNPFLERTGNYVGLLTSTPRVHEASGIVQASVTKTGVCSGKLTVGGKTSPFRTQLRPNGSSAAVVINRPPLAPLTVEFQLDIAGQTGINITAAVGAVPASALARPTASSSGSLAGNYTVIIPGLSSPSADGSVPDGSGFGTVTVSSKGAIRFSGQLGDAAPVSQSTFLTGTTRWSLYAPLYKGGGSVSGEIAFAANVLTDLAATLDWFKPIRPSDKSYPQGWPAGITRDLSGARYSAPPVLPDFGPDLPQGNALLRFEGGGLAGAVTQRLNYSATGTASNVESTPAKVKLTTTSSKGLISGSFTDPFSGAARRFKGAVQQKQNVGLGNFPGGMLRTGNVILQSSIP